MEKRLASVVVFSIILLVLASSFVLAQEDTLTESEKVSNAYQCLENKVAGNCTDLSLQEKTFSLLSLDQCQSALLQDSENNGECWPDGDCTVEETAKSLFALENTNAATTSGKDWLLSQNSTPTEIAWYLQVETPNEATCQVSYSGSSYSFNINEDKTLSNNAGSCLSLAQDDYWLRISPSCFDETFQVSCSQDFLTATLFKEIGESTVHVTDEASSAASGGTTSETVESSCFSNPGSTTCDYEGSLWATLVLDLLEEDVSSYVPYLIVKADDNERFLPDAFLYMITGNTDYRDSLLLDQKSSKYWVESGDEHYDTALALLPFQGESDITEKQNSKDWLLETQDSEGCWSNIRNTGFLLSSIWPESFSGGGGTGGTPSCENAGYYCMPSSSCDGEILNEYSCGTFSACCDVPETYETCAELGGEICSSNQFCKDGSSAAAGDLQSGEICCTNGGFCEFAETNQENECETEGGTCRSFCQTGETQTSDDCEISGAICCVLEDTGEGETDEGGSLWWIWTLLILIILVGLGIFYRDKLREWWLKLKSKFGKGGGSGSSGGRPGGPRGSPGRGLPRHPSRSTPMRAPERRILLPKEQSNKPGPKPKRPGSKELDDVLKKLKEMSE